MSFNRGDIVRGAINDFENAYHPIIFWKGIDNSKDFVGLMITHQSTFRDVRNILMDVSHFEPGKADGFDNSHLVIARFIKYEIWGDYTVSGKLTKAGIVFARNLVDNCPIIDFNEYRDEIIARTTGTQI